MKYYVSFYDAFEHSQLLDEFSSLGEAEKEFNRLLLEWKLEENDDLLEVWDEEGTTHLTHTFNHQKSSLTSTPSSHPSV